MGDVFISLWRETLWAMPRREHRQSFAKKDKSETVSFLFSWKGKMLVFACGRVMCNCALGLVYKMGNPCANRRLFVFLKTLCSGESYRIDT